MTARPDPAARAAHLAALREALVVVPCPCCGSSGLVDWYGQEVTCAECAGLGEVPAECVPPEADAPPHEDCDRWEAPAEMPEADAWAAETLRRRAGQTAFGVGRGRSAA